MHIRYGTDAGTYHNNNKMKKLVFTIIVLTIGLITYGQNSVQFIVNDIPETKNEYVGIRGNIPPLDWSKSIQLKREGEAYVIDVNFNLNVQKELEFKFVLFTDDNQPTWENTANRTLTLQGNQANQTSDNKWNKEQLIDISTLGVIDKQGLKEDFELLKKMVLDVHPGTYRYNNKEDILNALNELENKFSEPITHQEAYLGISKLTAQLKCDHTKAGFNNQGKVINSIIHYQADKIPFTFVWIDNEMVILQNASENEILQRGTKVLTINQIPVGHIRNEIIKHVGADGATDNNRVYKTQVNGYDFRYNAFDIFYTLLYPVNNQSITIEIQQPNQQETISLDVSTLTREKRFEILAERYESYPKTRDDMWKFKVLSDSTAILTLNSFGLNGWKAMTIDYKAFLADAFKKIRTRKIEHLIIDIRENNGGNDEMADELFSYLTQDDFKFDREGRTRYVYFPETLKPYIRTWGNNPWYYQLNPKNPEPEDGYYIFKESFSSQPSKNGKVIYSGKSYLLTSSANTSLAFYTAYRFKNQNIGKVIGRETGGNLNDINGGQIIFLTLPNTGIEIDFPVMGGFSTINQPNTGVQPDIMVEYNIDDVINKSDLELKKTLELIKNTVHNRVDGSASKN